MSEDGIRVLVVASSPVVRAGLEAVLAREAGIVVVGSVAPGLAVGSALARHRPDVLLVEREPGEEGTEPPLESGEPDAPPIVLMVDFDDDAAEASGLEALRMGARAVIARAAAPAAIAAAVRGVAAGLVVVEAAALAGVLAAAPTPTGGAAARGADESEHQPLTPRETEVLAMLAEGLGNKQIAARLAISEHTVKFHLASVYAKLRVSTRTEAVMAGARRGLVMV